MCQWIGKLAQPCVSGLVGWVSHVSVDWQADLAMCQQIGRLAQTAMCQWIGRLTQLCVHGLVGWLSHVSVDWQADLAMCQQIGRQAQTAVCQTGKLSVSVAGLSVAEARSSCQQSPYITVLPCTRIHGCISSDPFIQLCDPGSRHNTSQAILCGYYWQDRQMISVTRHDLPV